MSEPDMENERSAAAEKRELQSRGLWVEAGWRFFVAMTGVAQLDDREYANLRDAFFGGFFEMMELLRQWPDDDEAIDLNMAALRAELEHWIAQQPRIEQPPD